MRIPKDYLYVIQGLIYLKAELRCFLLRKKMFSIKERKCRKMYILSTCYRGLFFCPRWNAQSIYFKQHWKDIIIIIVSLFLVKIQMNSWALHWSWTCRKLFVDYIVYFHRSVFCLQLSLLLLMSCLDRDSRLLWYAINGVVYCDNHIGQ